MNAISPDRVYKLTQSAAPPKIKNKKWKIHPHFCCVLCTHRHRGTAMTTATPTETTSATIAPRILCNNATFEAERTHSVRTKSIYSTIFAAFFLSSFLYPSMYATAAAAEAWIFLLSLSHCSYSHVFACSVDEVFCSTQTINYRSFSIAVRLEHFTYYIK